MSYQIVRREQFSESTFLWDVAAPDVAGAAKPGQFVMLRLREGGERIPLTIADFDRDAGTITLVVQAVGRTTREMMRDYAAGDTFLDFAGPLGLESEVEDWGHVVVVGGGLGVAPIFPQLRAFSQAGNRTTAIAGFRREGLVFWEDEFGPYSDDLIVCTDDGSYGRAGFVTAALDEVLRAGGVDRIVAVGPLPMMRACAEVSRPYDVPTVVSLNAIMVDGTGMCGSCRVTVGGEVRFACVDGPEFDAHQVSFDELMARQARFRSQENTANGAYEHVCNLERTLIEDGKRNYKKIKALQPTATPMPERPADERSTNFEEVNLGYSISDAIAEAERCIQCKKPTCIAGCPVSIDIPRFIRHVLLRDVDTALDVIRESNAFPSICGRVCPQERQCEAQCIIGRKIEPVAIGRLERFVGDHGRASPNGVDAAVNGGRVAIVGSGPGGLACAADLARRGNSVTIYEALHVAGGVLSYGIPAFRLPRRIIAREIQHLLDLGVTIETNKVVGKTFTVPQLLDGMGFDAVFIATGAGYPWFLGIEGENAGRVYSANEFLTRVNLMGGDRFPYEDTPVSIGDKVVVIGAGNTAMDCLRVARRLGAADVHCTYRRTQEEAPARIEELRHAIEEGVQFHWLRSPLAIHTDDAGNVSGMRCQAMTLGPEDDSGRRRPVPLEGEIQEIECDTVIYALGTRANPIIAQTTPALETHRGGYITASEETQATSMRGVFAGGDIVTGGATVILAMGAGRRAAAAIDRYLEDRVWPPREAGDAEPARSDGCARCGRALDDQGDYLCCAGAPLSWSCQGCGKRSEGFAFPFGLCPACGSASLVLDDSAPAAPEDAAAVEAVRQAFAIELGGESFYRHGAQETTDPQVKELFQQLAAMEREHTDTLARRYHLDPPTVDPPRLEAVALYANGPAEAATGDPEALLRLAIQLETRARDWFQERCSSLVEGTPAWTLYRELQAEEEEHVTLIETELRRWLAGKPGLLASSGPSADTPSE